MLSSAAALVTSFIENYRLQPVQAAEHFVSSVLEVITDEEIEESTRKQFLSSALDEYFDLLVRLDRLAFPPAKIIYSGIPEYLPDGLSDMSHYPSTVPS